MRSFFALHALAVGCAIAGFSPVIHAAPLTRGFAVVALDGAKDGAAPLARAIYSRPSLRPDASLDEARAHILLGDPAPPALADLAASRAAIHGDDAPSKQLLTNVAADFHLRGVVVVSCGAADAAPSTWAGSSSSPDATPSADAPKKAPTCMPTGRLFLATNGKTAAHFEPDAITPDLILDASQPVTWNAAVLQLDSQYGQYAPTPTPVPAAAISAVPAQGSEKKSSHYFYESPWFWGALGAAAFAGTAVFLATRDNGGDTIHLQMQVP